MSERGKGFRPSPAHKQRRFASVHHLVGADLSFPPSFDLETFAPDVMDQGQTSSCGGHGTSVGVYAALAAKGTPLPFVPSPKGIYDNARQLDAPSAPLTDDGIDPATLLQALAQHGVRKIQAPTLDGRYSDCDPATINAPETLAEDEEGARDLLVGEYAVDPRDPSFDRLVAATLFQKKAPVGVGICADGAFQAWGEGSVGDDKPAFVFPTNWQSADHWVVVVGLRTAADGSLELKIRNSWSRGWGLRGSIWVRNLAGSTAEAIAFDVAAKAAP